MTDAVTANYGWSYPTPNADANTWGATINATIVAIDATVKGVANGVPSTAVVQAGTGVGQLGNTIKIGWSGAALKATVDTTDLGALLHTTYSSGVGGVKPGGAVTVSASAPSGTPNDGDLWLQYT